MKLKKTKVNMYSSENNIDILINEFEGKCKGTACKECKVVKGDDKTVLDFTKCMARYIYERIIKVD